MEAVSVYLNDLGAAVVLPVMIAIYALALGQKFGKSLRMVAILMEDLVPVSDAARTFIQKRFPPRKFYIGLDSAIAIGGGLYAAGAASAEQNTAQPT